MQDAIHFHRRHVVASDFYCTYILVHDHQLSPRDFLDAPCTSNMVAVSMRDQQDLDVTKAKLELLDALLNEWYFRLKGTVDQDVALRRRDQVRGIIRLANIVHVTDDLVGWEWCAVLVFRVEFELLSS